MDLFSDPNEKTRTRMRNGGAFGHKPTEEHKKAFFQQSVLPWTPEMEHCSVPLEIEDIVGEVLLPSQLDHSVQLSPEQTLCDQLLFETLEELKVSFQKDKSFYKKVSNLRNNQEDILAWIAGEPAPLTFKYVTEFLGLDTELAQQWIIDACKSWVESKGTIPKLALLRRVVYTLPEETIANPKPEPHFTERCLAFEKFARKFPAGCKESLLLKKWEHQQEVICQRSTRCPHDGGLRSRCKLCIAKTNQIYHRRMKDQANIKRRAEGKTVRFDPCPHGKLKFSDDPLKACHPCYLAEERRRQGLRRAAKRLEAGHQPRYVKCPHNQWHSQCVQCRRAAKLVVPFESLSTMQELAI